MPFGVQPIQVVLVATLLAAAAYAWAIHGRGRWRRLLTDRFVVGVPWGTLVSIAGVVAFYLFAQGGLDHWNDPVVVAFRSWSYTYLPGMLTSGFAHASPGHLLGNLIGTVVLAPIVEYAWGHYPPTDEETTRSPGLLAGFTHTPPANFEDSEGPDSEADDTATSLRAVDRTPGSGLLSRPLVRALVVFPLVVAAVSLVTSVLALGWSLGFSGTVFAFGGFAVVVLPLTAAVSMFAISGLGITYRALTEPVLRVTVDGGSPGPPGWAAVNVQAHLLGFLIGVALGVALLWARNRRPPAGRLFLAVLVFVLVRNLWVLPWSEGDEYLQYRGIGLVFVLVVTMFVTAVALADDQPLVDPESWLVGYGPLLNRLWLLVLGVAVVAGAVAFDLGPVEIAIAGVFALMLALQSLPSAAPDAVYESPVTKRTALFLGLVMVIGAVAVPSAAGNWPGMDKDPVPEGAIEVADYSVVYAEDADHGRIDSTDSGVVVVSERRDIWTTDVSQRQLENSGEVTVVLGGVGWYETVTANRTGWRVVGNDSVYAVDLEHDGTRTRSFTSNASRADPQISHHTVALVPTSDGFDVRVARNGTVVGDAPVPARNESVTLGPLELVAEHEDGSLSLFATDGGTRVEVASREG
jgi:membrane associated rhomboid family serine protease